MISPSKCQPTLARITFHGTTNPNAEEMAKLLNQDRVNHVREDRSELFKVSDRLRHAQRQSLEVPAL
jgi:hypothetical protein